MCVQDCLGGSGACSPRKRFKIRMLRLAENEFRTTKFHDFSLTFLVFEKFPDFPLTFPLHRNSLTFSGFPGRWTPWRSLSVDFLKCNNQKREVNNKFWIFVYAINTNLSFIYSTFNDILLARCLPFINTSVGSYMPNTIRIDLHKKENKLIDLQIWNYEFTMYQPRALRRNNKPKVLK